MNEREQQGALAESPAGYALGSLFRSSPDLAATQDVQESKGGKLPSISAEDPIESMHPAGSFDQIELARNNLKQSLEKVRCGLQNMREQIETATRMVESMAARSAWNTQDEVHESQTTDAGQGTQRIGLPGELHPHAILGVNANASREELRAAYRAKMREWHPDQFENMAPEVRADANRETARINAAYQELTKGA